MTSRGKKRKEKKESGVGEQDGYKYVNSIGSKKEFFLKKK